MHARLISYSQPSFRIHAGELAPTGLDNIQDLIAYCARVSNPSNQANTKTTKRLLEYLIKHKHWSPFEMASACFEIETTRDIARQLLRHRSFSFQEFSQRYASVNDINGDSFVVREARLQDDTNRQNSIETSVEYHRLAESVKYLGGRLVDRAQNVTAFLLAELYELAADVLRGKAVEA